MKRGRQPSGEVGLLKPTAVGFLLMDSSFQPIYVNEEALEILSFPEKPREVKALDNLLAAKMRGLFSDLRSVARMGRRSELVSGRRHYVCRLVAVKSRANHSLRSALALVLERSPMGLADLSRVAKEYRLTPREQQAIVLLIDGLTSKEIAERMKISANTVKAFLRLVMIKTGATTRSGIVGKILQARH